LLLMKSKGQKLVNTQFHGHFINKPISSCFHQSDIHLPFLFSKNFEKKTEDLEKKSFAKADGRNNLAFSIEDPSIEDSSLDEDDADDEFKR